MTESPPPLFCLQSKGAGPCLLRQFPGRPRPGRGAPSMRRDCCLLLASVCALGAGLGSGPPARTEPLAEAHARALHQDTEWYTRVIGKGRDGARVKAPEDRFAAAPADFYTTTDGHRIYRPQVDAVALNVWPDLPSFKSLLRQEIKWRLALAGPRIADSVRDEAKWRLRVYRRWLGVLDLDFGEPAEGEDRLAEVLREPRLESSFATPAERPEPAQTSTRLPLWEFEDDETF